MLNLNILKGRYHFNQISTFRIIALGFAAVILTGTFLLSLPIATRSGESLGFVNNLFTATSATCVTGLVVVDTYTHWTTFGQIVIISLIQIGGLGFMSLATLFSLIARRQITLRERMIMTELLNQNDLTGIVRLTKHILFGTLIFEGIGAFILSLVFIKDFGISGGIYRGIFHSISAFCNAGFDILGSKGEFSNLTTYHSNVALNLTIMSLIVIGGLGFFVWEDIFKNKGKRLRLHTKIVLTVTTVLIVSGTLLFLIFEYNNPETLKNLSFGDKVLASMFQSVTTRTAGFNTISQEGLSSESKLLSVILMFIGGSPGSTAGGIKTVTFAVMVLGVLSVLRGSQDVNIYKKRLTPSVMMRSLAIIAVSMTLIVTAVMILCIFENKPFIDLLFETASAFGTVGLSAGITTTLTDVSKVTLIILMYSGRIGVLTMGLAFLLKCQNSVDSIRYPEEKIMVG